MATISAIWLDALVILVVTPVPWVAASIGFRRRRAVHRIFEARLSHVLAEVEAAVSKLGNDGQGGADRSLPARRSARASALAERTRSGYVYVVSNNGSFGSDIVKIGLTRRRDPADRVRELGDASVPFAFELHAMIYSDDAPALERALHRAFHRVRVNTLNCRKEFFRVSLDDVERAVRHLAPAAVLFRDIEAVDYREALLRRERALARSAAATRAATRFRARKAGWGRHLALTESTVADGPTETIPARF